ncbi:CaiB/BaiF CoA transferase family protein [Verticiella sediminum]|nr:CoA transferase [Verticiella sediminum]
MPALSDVTVLDFSTLLPGPLCTLLLAEAGARVIKIERPDGDEMRAYEPKLGTDSVNFTLLNRGKTSLAVDLKDPAQRVRIEQLIAEADVLVEQFRPGVMRRLGLGYDAVARINPRMIYCSITGYGQTGPKAGIAAHDLNYQAQTGMLALSGDAQNQPTIPPTLTADIAGGAYPAVMNILLALRQCETSGEGCHLDIAMADNLFPLMYWGLGNGWQQGQWPRRSAEQVTGGSCRYQIYRTADDRFLAAAPLEDKFWHAFVTRIGMPEVAEQPDSNALREQIADTIRTRSAAEWMQVLAGADTCVCEVVDLQQAVLDPHFVERGVFAQRVGNRQGASMPALPVPIAACLRAHGSARAPALGEHG